MGPINTYSPNEHLGAISGHPEHIGVQTGYSETRGKISMLLFPSNGSKVVEHEHMSTRTSHYHMRRVQKGSIPDGSPTDSP